MATNIPGAVENTRRQAELQDSSNFQLVEDWRVRLQLAPGANYFYKQPGYKGIMEPLIATDGVIFPYTPNITVQYVANYDPASVTHSNFKMPQYISSSVDNISIGCDFTAQDTLEASYLLATIHFFRSATKMFYGQDQNPKPGTPPPLCFLTGLGAFQFDNHPLVITSFNYTLPTDVDYIRASAPTTLAGVTRSANETQSQFNSTAARLAGTGVVPGGFVPPATFSNSNVPTGTVEPTYVPTKMSLQIQCLPVLSRKVISDEFSLEQYATGKLLRGSQNASVGIW